METCIYQITVHGKEDITLVLYHEAPEGIEDELLDFMWQSYYEFQSDKAFYQIINLTKENTSRRTLDNITHYHLANKIIDYVNQYS